MIGLTLTTAVVSGVTESLIAHETAYGLLVGATVGGMFEDCEIRRSKVLTYASLGAVATTAAIGLYNSYKTGDIGYSPVEAISGILSAYGSSIVIDGGRPVETPNTAVHEVSTPDTLPSPGPQSEASIAQYRAEPPEWPPVRQ